MKWCSVNVRVCVYVCTDWLRYTTLSYVKFNRWLCGFLPLHQRVLHAMCLLFLSINYWPWLILESHFNLLIQTPLKYLGPEWKHASGIEQLWNQILVSVCFKCSKPQYTVIHQNALLRAPFDAVDDGLLSFLNPLRTYWVPYHCNWEPQSLILSTSASLRLQPRHGDVIRSNKVVMDLNYLWVVLFNWVTGHSQTQSENGSKRPNSSNLLNQMSFL